MRNVPEKYFIVVLLHDVPKGLIPTKPYFITIGSNIYDY